LRLCGDKVSRQHLPTAQQRCLDTGRAASFPCAQQAEQISVWWDEAEESGKVSNESRRPITQVVAGNAVPLPDGGTETRHVAQWVLTYKG